MACSADVHRSHPADPELAHRPHCRRWAAAPPHPLRLILSIGLIAAAVPRRARITFPELFIGAAATRGGHVTDAILAAGLSRSWTTYYWLLQRGRWTWLAVWQGLLRGLQNVFVT